MIRQVRRFIRLRSGVWWTLPVVLVLVILTMTHNAMVRFDRTTENIRQWEYGGHTEAVYFNTLVPTTKKKFNLDSVLDKFSPGLSKKSCNELMSTLSKYSENQVYFAYKEFSGSCKPQDWGFRQVSGSSPKGFGEVSVTPDTGFRLGEQIVGLTPKPLKVVGIVSNSNLDTARVIIAFSGTFRNFGWPETSTNWPTFTATVSSAFDGFSPSEIENHFRNLDSNVAFSYASSPRKSLLDKIPYLYSWTAFPLFLAAIVFSLVLRNIYTRKRVSLLNAQGSSTSNSTIIIMMANTFHLLVIGIGAIFAGSILAFLLSEPIRLMSSRELGPFPLPIDPILKFVLALFGGVFGFFVLSRFSNSFNRFIRSMVRLKLNNRASTLVALILFIAAVAVLNAPLFQLSYFAFVLLVTLGTAFIAHRLMKSRAVRMRSKNLAGELAKRRMSTYSFRSGLAFSGSILAIAPVLTFLLMFSSALEQSNKNALALPDSNQITYDIYQPSLKDKVIEKFAKQAAGNDGKVNYFYLIKTADGTPVVSSPEHMGAVMVVDSISSLEQMLQRRLTSQGSSALAQKGILWFSSGNNESLWTLRMGDVPSQNIPFPVSASQEVPLAWFNQAKAVVLSSSLSEHGLEKDAATLVVSGMSQQESATLAKSLLNAGIDPSLVRYHKDGDAYSETPLQVGVVSMMGLLGLALISSSTRSMINSLRSQARELVSLGVPRNWLTRVFLQEFRATIGLGSTVGLALTTLAAGLAITKFNLSIAIPWVILAGYGGILLAAVTYLIWSGFRKIRA